MIKVQIEILAEVIGEIFEQLKQVEKDESSLAIIHDKMLSKDSNKNLNLFYSPTERYSFKNR